MEIRERIGGMVPRIVDAMPNVNFDRGIVIYQDTKRKDMLLAGGVGFGLGLATGAIIYAASNEHYRNEAASRLSNIKDRATTKFNELKSRGNGPEQTLDTDISTRVPSTSLP